MNTLFMLSQLIIAITGIAAVWLSQEKKTNRRKFACLFGLVGQPFWFYETFMAEQWGIFGLTFIYTIAWCKGIYTYWIKKDKLREA